MMHPPLGLCCLFITLTASLLQINGPVRSTPIILYHSSKFISVKGRSSWIPALFTNTSILPNSLTVSSINLIHSPSFETSASIAIDLQPKFLSSSETPCASSAFLELMTTAEYSFYFANDNAMAFPIPLLEPVTTATLPFFSILLLGVRKVCLNKECV